MRKPLADLIRLVILLLLLPLIIILIGPLLILAVIRGQQQIGPIMLDSSRYDLVGRLGIFMLGLAVWLFTWIGLAWLMISAVSPLPAVTQLNSTPSVLEAPTATTTATVLPSPTTNPSLTESATVVPTPQSTPTRKLAATFTSTTPETPTSSATPPGQTPQITGTVLRAVVITSTEVTTASQITVTPQSIAQPDIITLIEEANLLLQNAINSPDEDNLANLDSLWQDRALIKVEKFAVDQYEKYAKPFNVTFEFVATPTISEQISNNQVVVTSQERWNYGGPTQTNQETFEFIYTLNRQNDSAPWVITHYTYHNLPRPTPSATPDGN